jgi:purine-binding chemotaxis protein CheW
MAESAARPEIEGDVRRLLTFGAGGRRYALPAEEISEIILPPPLARVPLSPKPLLGLGNLRGVVIPVVSVRFLLEMPAAETTGSAERVVVLQGRSPVGLLVDQVYALQTVAVSEIASARADFVADAVEMLKGVISRGSDGEAVRMLDVQALLAKALVAGVRRGQGVSAPVRRTVATGEGETVDQAILITFDVAGQEFALPIASVLEVLPSSSTSAALPRAETAVLGMTGLRNALLPLLSLRSLLGFPASRGSGGGMTLVAAVGGATVGLAVDGVHEIVRASASVLEPVPAVIASRTDGEARVQAVLKLDNGARLISILSPEHLFREDVMNRIKAQAPSSQTGPARASGNAAERIFLVFMLGEQEFGLAISAVEEVSRLPERVTKLPRQPDFLKGVTNLRGAVLPVIDQRHRFNLPAQETGERRRMVVARVEGRIAGFIVDSVAEVLRVAADDISPAPEAVEEARVLEGVLNLERSGRMILLLDPSQLLNRTEKGLLDALGSAQEVQAPGDQDPDR